MKYLLIVLSFLSTLTAIGQATYRVEIGGRLPAGTNFSNNPPSANWGDGTTRVSTLGGGNGFFYEFRNFDRGSGDLDDNVFFEAVYPGSIFTSIRLSTDYSPAPCGNVPSPTNVTFPLANVILSPSSSSIGFNYCGAFVSAVAIPENMSITGPPNGAAVCAGSTINLQNGADGYPIEARNWSYLVSANNGFPQIGGRIPDFVETNEPGNPREIITSDRKSAEFTMVDLLGEDNIGNYIGATVQFYMGISSTIFSNKVITIEIDNCTPFLDDIYPTNTSCFDAEDGSLEVALASGLDRLENETLLLTVNFVTDEGFVIPEYNVDILSLSPSSNGQNTFSLSNLGPGTYEIDYQSYIDPDGSGGEDPYPNGLGIPFNFDILTPTEVQIDNVVVDQDPDCPGEFGIRTIQVSGGKDFKTGQYHFTKDGGLTWDVPADANSNAYTYNDLIPGSDYTFGGKLVFTDGSGECESDNRFDQTIPNIPNPITLAAGSGVSRQPSNAGATDGIIFSQVTNGLPNFIFELYAVSDPVNAISTTPAQAGRTHNFENLGIGSYFIKITDANGCSVNNESTPFELSAAAIPSIGTLSSNAPSCNGGTDGSISVDVSYPTATTFSFQLREGANVIRTGSIPAPPASQATSSTIAIENLVGGNYFIDVISASGDFTIPATVVSTNEIIVANPAAVNIDTFTPNAISCPGENNGSIALTLSGGTSYQYTHELIPAETDWIPLVGNIIENLSPGFYYLTIRNQNGCQSDRINNTQILIREPDPIDIDITTTPVLNSGGSQGSISLNIAGGTTPYTNFVWEKDNQPFVPSETSTNTNLVDLEAGSYRVTVTDSGNCSTISGDIVITEPQLSISSLTPAEVLCKGDATGSITATVSGIAPFNYLWERADGQAITSVNNATITGLSEGEYRLTLTDASTNPAVISTIVVTEPTIGLTAVATPTAATCFGANDGSIVINATGGTGNYTYSLNGGLFQTANTFPDLTANNYNLVAKDANDCEFTTTVVVGEPTPISFSVPITNNITAADGSDGSISLSVTGSSGNYTYNWVKDGLPFTPPTGSTDTNLVNLQAGTYELTVSDSTNPSCSATLIPSITLIQPGPLAIDNLAPTDVLCKGEATGSIAATVSGNGPFIYTWERVDGQPITSVNDATFTGLSAGEYRLRITDQSTNPEVSDTVIVGEPTLDLTAIATPTNATCFGANDGAIVINATGGTGTYTYSLDGIAFQTNNTFPNLIAATYNLIVRDANNCDFSTTVVVGEPTPITFSVPVTSNITAAGGNDGTISLSVSGSSGTYTYNWVKDGLPFTPPAGSTDTNLVGLQAGIYDLTVSDSAVPSCSATLIPSIALTEPGPLSIDNLIPTDVLCNGEATGSITAAVSGIAPFSFLWERTDGQALNSVDNATITGLGAGEYRLTLTDASTNPAVVGTVTVVEPTEGLTAVATPTDASCSGTDDGAISIIATGGTGAYSYSLDGIPFKRAIPSRD